MHIIANLFIMLLEIASVATIGWLAQWSPPAFAALTAALALIIGARLETARLAHEAPFYFEAIGSPARLLAPVIGFLTAVVKAALAGLVALLALSGTDQGRRVWIAGLIAVTVYLGMSLLSRLWQSLGIRSARWGYFRLAAPLGLAFSAGVALLAAFGLIKLPTFTDLLRQIALETPRRPTMAEASELLFQLKQYVDGVIVTLLQTVLPPAAAQITSVLLSVNVLTGFVIALYAVALAEASLALERTLAGSTREGP